MQFDLDDVKQKPTTRSIDSAKVSLLRQVIYNSNDSYKIIFLLAPYKVAVVILHKNTIFTFSLL